jgi:DNA-binding transcriptional regulator GbsR (MarR family)
VRQVDVAARTKRAGRPHLSEEARLEIVEEMGTMWYELGEPPIEGRIVGYLMLSDAPYVSSAELIDVLQTSAATISTTTRRLADVGFIRRVSVPGQRGNHFRVEDDIWGAFLAGERKYLGRRSQFASEILEKLGSEDVTLRRRVENMRDYMTWLASYHRKMLDDWEQFKRERDAHNPA